MQLPVTGTSNTERLQNDPDVYLSNSRVFALPQSLRHCSHHRSQAVTVRAQQQEQARHAELVPRRRDVLTAAGLTAALLPLQGALAQGAHSLTSCNASCIANLSLPAALPYLHSA